MKKFIRKHKFEAIKYRHEDQAKYLQFIGQVDLKTFLSFLTIQLALGSFMTQVKIDEFYSKLSLYVIDIILTSVFCSFQFKNHRRREEIVDIINNCNESLSYYECNIYLKGKALETKKGPNKFGHIWSSICMCLSTIFIGIILFNPKMEKKEDFNKIFNINMIVDKDTTKILVDSTVKIK